MLFFGENYFLKFSLIIFTPISENESSEEASRPSAHDQVGTSAVSR
jgi:hypothetical protein